MPVRLAACSLPLGATAADIEQAVACSSADLLLFPEACLPGYHHGRGKAGKQAREIALSLSRRYQRLIALGFLEGTGNYLGLATPEGGWHTYQKQYPSPAESLHWHPGRKPGIVPTSQGRIGLLICADLLQRSAWEALRGKVDLVAIAAAWPNYRERTAPPGFGWVLRESASYRDHFLGRAATSLGVPVVLADVKGPEFQGESVLWDGQGRCVARGPMVEARVEGGSGGAPLLHEGRWRWFAPLYRRFRLPVLQRIRVE